MAVHLPLTMEAQAECRFLLLSPNNLLKPSDGGPVAVPSQDMVLGIYYLTQERPGEKGEGSFFRDMNEAILAYENGYITLQTKITIRCEKEMEDGTVMQQNVSSTLGRFLFNEILPQDLGYVDRTVPGNELALEVDFLVAKKQLKQILEKVINTHGATKTAEVLDYIKATGYKYSTRAAMTVSISDMTVPPQKPEMLAEAQATVDKITRNFKRGLITDEERYKEVVDTWKKTDDALTKALLDGLDKYNNIFMMADSGARGSDKQIKQLAGMRGLMADTTGHTIELPIKSNFREGLQVLEYFMSAHGARKGMSDTALRTADSGYLTRRLVDVSQDVIIRMKDCGTHEGIMVQSIMDNGRVIEDLSERLFGRYLADDIYHPETGELLVSRDKMMDENDAKKIIDAGYTEVKIRTPLNCEAKNGVCMKCYGANLANGQPVSIGEAVGIVAAQSIGEPGTQLTMRTFHTGGVVTAADITQGLPRVEELFEARRPKNAAIISHEDGIVSFEKDAKGGDNVVVTNPKTGERFEKLVVYGSTLKVSEGDYITKGTPITEGSVEPGEILQVLGGLAVQEYLISEVQKVYRTQGVDINDKHIEVIVRQMMRKVKVDDQGDTEMFTGEIVDKSEFLAANEKIAELNAQDGGDRRMATSTPVLLGITKASLATESFMSAASFQETSRVLTEAAIRTKRDYLIGLKENVIIGKLIPAGTGVKEYKQLSPQYVGSYAATQPTESEENAE